MRENIFLTGFMGTGKSTVSRQLAKLQKYAEIDLDREIERREKKKIREIFAQSGEAYFRDLETALIKEYEKEQKLIVSCGGGSVLRKENVDSMKKSGWVILLTAAPKTVYERVRFSKTRPLLEGNMNVDYIGHLMEARRKAYEDAADLSVPTDGRTPEEIAVEILEWIAKKI